MAGKRKRDTAVVSRSTKSDGPSPPPADNAQDIFRKYFESQFEPLDLPSKQAKSGSDEEDGVEDDEYEDDFSGSEDGDWDGLSDEDEDSPQVEVIEHTDAQIASDDRMDKKAIKALRKGKLPSFMDAPSTKRTEEPASKEEEEEDSNNLKHDLALQRLLRESHLLEDSSDLAPTGKNRLKALDLRMQSLGAKTSLYAQQKMPSAHRIGIKAKAASKDAKRRLDAKENGIILEKPSKVTKSNTGRRERGVGGSSIGKFSGGTLNLSKQDIHTMQKQSSRDRSGRGGRGGRGRGRGGKRGRG